MQYPPNPYGQNPNDPYGQTTSFGQTAPNYAPYQQPEQILFENHFMGTWVKVFTTRVEFKPAAKAPQSIPINQIIDTRLITGEIVIETATGPYRILTPKNKDVQQAIWQAQAPYSQPGNLQQSPIPPQQPKKRSNKKTTAIGCAAIIVAVLLCGIIANAGSHSNQATSDATTPTTQALVIHATPTAKPTQAPAPTPVPPTPTPTDIPVQIQPTSPPAPTCNGTVMDGICYNTDSTGGAPVYNTPSGFCMNYACITNFSNGSGYIVECGNGKWSHSGGISGACSRDGSVIATLYSH